MNFRKGNVGLILGGFLAIVAIAVAGFFLWQRSQVKPAPREVSWEECIKSPGALIMESYPESCSAPDGRYAIQVVSAPESQNSYSNKKYKYSFIAPSNYDLEESWPGYVTLSIPKDPKNPHGEVTSIITASVDASAKDRDIPTEPLVNYIVELLKIMSTAGAPGSGSYVDKVEEIKPYTNSYGVRGYEVYLRLAIEKSGLEKTYRTKGPIFVFLLNDDRENPEILYLQADYGFPSEEEKTTLRDIVDTLEIT